MVLVAAACGELLNGWQRGRDTDGGGRLPLSMLDQDIFYMSREGHSISCIWSLGGAGGVGGGFCYIVSGLNVFMAML